MLSSNFNTKIYLFLYPTEYSNAFEIVPKEQPSCILYCKTAEEKSAWLAVLFTLLYRRYVIYTYFMYSLSTLINWPSLAIG